MEIFFLNWLYVEILKIFHFRYFVILANARVFIVMFLLTSPSLLIGSYLAVSFLYIQLCGL